uniref:Cytochrome c oxidase accessory protein CcoG n=1 Tax=Eiseniibacteriota bacterium TaxID=2212470 RepID=A0A832MIW9_UNCEI
MNALHDPVQAPEPVLSTLNVDGSRRWIRPRRSSGPWWRRRLVAAWALIALFVAIPYLKVGGHPALLLDLPRREFWLLGAPFRASDTLLFMLLFLTVMLGILVVTALFGRVWCGWACPQTVYMEFVFRPLERWLEGGWRGSRKLDRHRRHLHPRRVAKVALYAVLSLFLAHTFLAYFVPVEELARWMTRPPAEHPTSFALVMLVAAMILVDFTWFREQTCLVACPYGRFQSALLDRRSLIVGYDARRGEPRSKEILARPAGAGDCVDCRLCVLTCPTGIDIRQGLQMECIHCTQCMDACDAVMTRFGRPRGLIRYGSQDAFEGRAGRALRPRLVVYPIAFAVALGLFAWMLATRPDAEVTLLRGLGAPYTVDRDGGVVNQVRIRVANRGAHDRRFEIALENAAGARLVAPVNPLPVAAGRTGTASVFVVSPPVGFEHGERTVTLRLADGAGFERAFAWRLLGPEADEDGTEARAPGGEAGR